MDTGETFPISDVVSGLFAPTWSPDGDKIAVSAFDKFGYDILILKDLKNVAPDGNALTLTPYMQKLRNNEKNIFVPEVKLTDEQLVEISNDSTSRLSSNYDTYVFRAGEDLIKKRQPEEGIDNTGNDSTQVADIHRKVKNAARL